MDFHLVYAGDLLRPAGRARTAVWEKHAIRRYLHPQMKKLWETHPALQYYADKTLEWDHKPPERFLDNLAKNHERAGIGFIPLITEANGLACSLDILFLRPDQPGHLMTSAGDIDNRMKTLIDALQIPSNDSQIRSREGDPDPNPMYCLLQDDKLITRLAVTTDRLLFSVSDEPTEACLVIRVETFNVDPFGSPWELHL